MEVWSEGRENVAEEKMGVQKCFWKGGDFTKFRCISLKLDNQSNHPLVQTPQSPGQIVIGTNHDNLVPLYWWLLSECAHKDPILARKR